jgi:hypothetical protein
VLLGALVLVLAATGTQAQEPAKDSKTTKKPATAVDDVLPAPRVKGRDAAKYEGGAGLPSVVRLGYTRPGSPSDEKTPDGNIRRVAWDPAFRGEVIGGSIYFMVLELTNAAGDAWGTGVRNFNGAFVEGRDNDDRSSPTLDTKARYLYLYQVVNDRGLDPLPTRPAADQEIPTVPIAMSALRLRVDPRYITSWGHFANVSFAGNVVDRKLDGASAGAADTMIRMAVSSNPSILAELPEQAYKYASPANSLTGSLRDTFGFDQAQVGLASSAATKELRSKMGVGAALWVKHMTGGESMTETIARNPDFVKLTVAYLPARAGADIEEDTLEPVVVFRADWRSDKNALKLGQHSVVYGFTTDLPPIDDIVSIADAAGAARADDAGIVALGNDAAAAGGMAPGTAPTPTPPAVPLAAAPVGGFGSLPAFGGGSIPGGGIAAGGFPLASIAAGARLPPAGLGATTGNTNQPTATPQDQIQSEQQSLPPTITTTQQQCPCPPNEVIPEPSAIIMGLLGLPVLFWLARRRPRTSPSASA